MAAPEIFGGGEDQNFKTPNCSAMQFNSGLGVRLYALITPATWFRCFPIIVTRAPSANVHALKTSASLLQS